MLWTNRSAIRRINELYTEIHKKLNQNGASARDKRKYGKGTPPINPNGAMLWTPKTETLAKAKALMKFYGLGNRAPMELPELRQNNGNGNIIRTIRGVLGKRLGMPPINPNGAMLWTNSSIRQRVSDLYKRMRDEVNSLNMSVKNKKKFSKGSPPITNRGMLWNSNSETIAKAIALRRWYMER